MFSNIVGAFTYRILKNLTFNNLKNHFIYFDTSFYDSLNIKNFILTYYIIK